MAEMRVCWDANLAASTDSQTAASKAVRTVEMVSKKAAKSVDSWA